MEQPYTVFTQQNDIYGRGIGIQLIFAKDVGYAKDVGRRQACEAAYGGTEHFEESLPEFHVLGVAKGHINILTWEDLPDD